MSLLPGQVTGVIVTRGDCDIGPCTAQWPAFGDVIIWDNSHEEKYGHGDVACYGRWKASSQAKTGVVFHQDDDVVIPRSTIEALLEEWRDDDVMVCNMNQQWREDPGDMEFGYIDMGLQAEGCLALRDCWEPAVIDYLAEWPEDRFFYEWADFVVGIGTPHRKVEYPVEHRDLVRDANRLANIPGNRVRRKAMMRRARALKPGELHQISFGS